MIREGKQAKVTYAKHGEVISPVEASVGTVQDAAVTQANIRKQEKAKVSSASFQSVKSTEATEGKAVLCNENRMFLKAVNCKSVSEDITLQALFPDKK